MANNTLTKCDLMDDGIGLTNCSWPETCLVANDGIKDKCNVCIMAFKGNLFLLKTLFTPSYFMQILQIFAKRYIIIYVIHYFSRRG